VLKGWVESRMGLPPTFHKIPIHGVNSEEYLTFAIGLIFAFGAIFELPLILLILGRIGVVGYRGLARNRRYALLLNSIASALLTPTPDAYTMLLMMAPIQILYEASIWLVRIFGKKKEEAEASG